MSSLRTRPTTLSSMPTNTLMGDEHAGHHHHHVPGAPNEHVFYDVDVAKDVASDLTQKLSELDPANQTTYQDNEEHFAQRIGEVKAVLEKIEKQRNHARFLQTEPLATHLVDLADMLDVTPHGFAEAIEEGADVSALQVAEMRDAITGKKADVFLFNTQNANSTTQEMRKLAERAVSPSSTSPRHCREEGLHHLDARQCGSSRHCP
ncbi:MAG: zinc ABC transporter substrate-binding protein [Lawsonella clevelandensis]